MTNHANPKTINLRMLRNTPSKMTDILEIPDKCDNCGFTNFNIWGVKQNSDFKVSVSCMRCGILVNKLDKTKSNT